MSGFGFINAGKDFILKSTNDNIILVASTKLHLFNSIIIAKQFPNSNYHLFYIDQLDKNDSYFVALNQFSSKYIWTTNKSSILSKILSKRKAIKEIYQKTKEINPSKIIVGNNRKNEISALITKVKRTHNDISIAYMDDGIHSYLIEKSSFFKYTILDSIIKSLVYGSLITTPKYIASSSIIDELYLYAPKFRNRYLKSKKAHKLDISILQSHNVKSFVDTVLKDLDIDLDLKNIENILFLPHPKELNRDKLDRAISVIDKNLAIKLHPRDKHNQKLLQKKGFKIIDNKVVAELIFLSLDKKVNIYGFASTALLMAVWLSPKLDVYSLKFDKSALSLLEEFMQKNGVKIFQV